MNKINITKDIIYVNSVEKDITILHIADIHFSKVTSDKQLNKIKNEIFIHCPNYLIITGDLLDEPSITKDKIKIKELLLFLTDLGKHTKVIISLGNHDIYLNEDYVFFKKINELKNIYVLNNEIYNDELICITGITLPTSYYYNMYKNESKGILLETIKNNRKITENINKEIPKIALIHSPIRLNDKDVLNELKEYDLLLSGHTHNGLVGKALNKLFKNNIGIISPNKKLFPEVARGKIETTINRKKITLIINGGIIKLSKKSGKILHKLNFLFDVDINKIIIKKKGKRYE